MLKCTGRRGKEVPWEHSREHKYPLCRELDLVYHQQWFLQTVHTFCQILDHRLMTKSFVSMIVTQSRPFLSPRFQESLWLNGGGGGGGGGGKQLT